MGEAGERVARATVADEVVVHLPLSAIAPNPHQPRRSFDPVALEELAATISEQGRVLQPIIVRRVDADQRDDGAAFELVVGERRWRASALAGLSTIRAIVEGVDRATSAELALVENMARADLNPIDEARGCAALRENFGYSLMQMARRVGRDRTTLSHLVRLLELPDAVQAQIETGALSAGHGRVLLRAHGPERQAGLAARCVDAGWSVRELERQLDPDRAAGSGLDRIPEADAAALERLAERLTPLFGPTPIEIVARRGGGYEMQLRFHDLQALTAAVARLACHADVP
jgi:ParB family chromosome partitioning protein